MHSTPDSAANVARLGSHLTPTAPPVTLAARMQQAVATLADALAATPGADDWSVTFVRDEELQVYLIGERVEERRKVVNERARLVIYNDHPAGEAGAAGEASAAGGDPKRGTATLTLLGDEMGQPARLAARLRDAVLLASLTDNPPFTLLSPPASGYPELLTYDTALDDDSRAVEQTLTRLRSAVANWQSVRLSSAEVFVTRSEQVARTSRGVAAASRSTSVVLDTVLIAREGEQEAEFHTELQRRRLADLTLDDTIDAYATYARHSVRATMPATHQGAVILSGDALARFFVPALGTGPLVFHTSAQAAYQHLSRFSVGEHITQARAQGDRLTLLSDATRPWGLGTEPFDHEGLPATTVALIEDGVFRQPWADTRYAAYLGIAPTGAFANMTVQPGQWDLDVLRSAAEGPVYEIIALSWMNPDTISGDFAAEIKLGYRHDDSGTTPIKGGTLSGNVFSALGDARFSAPTYSDGTYFGPAAIRFADLTVSGA